MGSGIKVVGGPAVDDATATSAGAATAARAATGVSADATAVAAALTSAATTAAVAGSVEGPAGQPAQEGLAPRPSNDDPRDSRDPRDRRRRRRRPGYAVACVLAVLGVAGTIVFGTAWAGLHGTQAGEAQVSTKARTFLVDLTNFDAKTVDADFAAITSMATGQFAGQADKFFNSSIRQELQRALASSRGQVRDLYVQSYGGTRASVYAVVTQLYSNNKITSPQSDVLRVVVDLQQVRGTWKVADVTVLEGPSQGNAPTVPSTGSPSGG